MSVGMLLIQQLLVVEELVAASIKPPTGALTGLNYHKGCQVVTWEGLDLLPLKIDQIYYMQPLNTLRKAAFIEALMEEDLGKK